MCDRIRSRLDSIIFENRHGGGYDGAVQFSGICAQFHSACDQAEDACEKPNHRECVCHYVSDHDKDDVSPIKPDSDDFKCSPVKK